MDKINENLSKSLTKPFADLMEVSISKQLRKLTKWLNDRQIASDADLGKIHNLLQNYYSIQSKRVAEIQSLAFPNKKLSLRDNYEPLQLRHESGEKVDISMLVRMQGCTVLIIDSAGMGKSTYSKFLVSNLLFKSEFIPIFLELRNIDTSTSLVNSLVAQLSSSNANLSLEVFQLLLTSGAFIIILDGFDEIHDSKQAYVAKEIQALKLIGGNSTLIVTTRPQIDLPHFLSPIPMHFDPFEKSQAISLMLRYDKSMGADIGIRLSGQLESVPNKFLESPLLVSLLYKTFGVNGSVSDNVTEFYDEVYAALYKGLDIVTKTGFIRRKHSGLDFTEFRHLLRALCYYLSLKKTTGFKNLNEADEAVKVAASLTHLEIKSPSLFTKDLIETVPLIFRDGNDFRFIHKTIIEFFSAEYIVAHHDSTATLTNIFESNQIQHFNKQLEFLYDLNPPLYRNVVTSYFAEKICKLNENDDVLYRFLKSITVLSDCKIGIWPVNVGELERVQSTGSRLQAALEIQSYAIDFERPHESVSLKSIEFNVEDNTYLMYISLTAFDKKINKYAWLDVTEELDESQLLNVISSQTEKTNSKLLEELPLKTWNALDDQLILKLMNNKVFYECCHEMYSFSSNVFVNHQKNSLRIISSKKSQDILDRVTLFRKNQNEVNSLLGCD